MERIPEPDVPYVGRSDLHFATEGSIRSAFSLGGLERGELAMSPGRITFRGMSLLVDCPNVTAARLVRKPFPWATYVVVAVLAAIMVAYQDPQLVTLRRPFVYILTAGLLVAGVEQFRHWWVEVEYTGANGPRRAYFRRQAVFRGQRRTRELLEEIEATVLRRAGHCAACGYDLTGNVSGVCPECGQAT